MTVRYAVAALAVLAAFGIRTALDPLLGSSAPYLLFVLAVGVAARFGGRYPGLFATLLSAFAVDWFFISPRGSLVVNDASAVTGLTLYVAVGIAVSLLAPAPAPTGDNSVAPTVPPGLAVPGFGPKRLRTRPHTVWLGAAILLLLIEAVLFVSVWARLFDREYWTTHTYDVLHTVEVLYSRLRDAEAEARGYLLAGEAAYLTAYHRTREQAPVQLGRLRELTADDAHQQERISALAPLVQERLRLLDDLVQLRTSQGLSATTASGLVQRGKDLMDKAGALIENMRKDEQAQLAERSESTAAAAHGMRVLMLSGAGALLLVLLGGARTIGLNIRNRERAENALRESETQFRTLANAIPQLSWMADPEGWIFWYNERWYQYTGTTPEEMKGWGWQKVHAPESLPSVMERWKASLRSGAPFDMVFPLRGADGVFRPFLTRIVPVRGEDGKIAHWFGTNTDISEQRRTEEALRASEARLRALSDNLPEGMVFRFRLDAEERPYFEFVSAGIERLTGSPASEFMAARGGFDDFVVPEDSERLRSAILESRNRLTHSEAEVRYMHPAGNRTGWSLLRWMPTHESDGSVTWDGVELDITERKRAQQALSISEQRFRKLFENAAVGIAIMDWDGKVLGSNAAYRDLHGYSGEDKAGRRFGDLMTPEDLQFHLSEVRRLKAGAIPFFRNETQYIREDGSRVWVEKYVSPLPGERGDASEMVVLVTDMTERKRAEEKVRELNAELETRVRRRTAQLEAANKELEAFAYSVSHDLRAPLRGIDGWSLALAEDYRGLLDETAHKYLDRVRGETQRMGVLIDDLLQLSRVTRSEMSTATVDLSAIARRVAAGLRETAAERNIDFIIEEGVRVAGDERLLEIALSNLLSNAFKFTGPCERARVEFGSAIKSGERVCYVRDNGVGFDMAYAKTLFGAFQRLHKASEFPGTGIGLATVQRIIHRHGGRVWAEAEPGKGATFYFTIGG